MSERFSGQDGITDAAGNPIIDEPEPPAQTPEEQAATDAQVAAQLDAAAAPAVPEEQAATDAQVEPS